MRQVIINVINAVESSSVRLDAETSTAPSLTEVDLGDIDGGSMSEVRVVQSFGLLKTRKKNAKKRFQFRESRALNSAQHRRKSLFSALKMQQ